MNAQALSLDLTESLVSTAIEHFVDTSILDELDEERALDYEFGWDDKKEKYYIELPDGRLNA